MSAITRRQEYKYQYKAVAVANDTDFCGFGPRLSVSVPANLLELKAVYLHAVMQFDSSVDLARRTILWAGGRYSNNSSLLPAPTTDTMLNVNLAANPTTRIADLALDLTHMKDALFPTIPDVEQPYFVLNLLTNLTSDGLVTGKVILWKVDFVYTTLGIQ